MLATNLIPNELRYQLDFGDLPARAMLLSPNELMFVSGGSHVYTCRKKVKPTCKKVLGEKAKCVKKVAYAGPYTVNGKEIKEGPTGAKPPKNPLGVIVHVCKPR